MAVETREVRELVDFAPEGLLVTSFFLNCDAVKFPSPDLFMTSFNSTIHEAEERRKEIEDSLSHEAEQSIRQDLTRIRETVDDNFDRTDTSGLVIFSCSAQDFWEIVRLPDSIESGVSFGPRPLVGRIAAYLSHNKPTAVLLTDQQHARILTMRGADVREWGDLDTDVPRRSDQGGWSQMRYQRRHDEWAKHHVDHATDLMLRLLQHYPFDWLILGTEVEVEHDLRQHLHPYLKDRLIGEIHVRIDADLGEILAQVRELQEKTESRGIDDLIARIQEYAGASGRGTIGLRETLQALNEQKVHILLVQQGYSAPGAECRHCGLLVAEQVDTCPACNEPATPLENVVEAAIQKAFELGSVVEVATELGKLDAIQSVGSILYY
jgi:peptide chain release factor subunit 1